jgi:hypothetical protein
MIPFFRKIRKKMADDNRPLKYARYAIGEIVLVVIGILIALQINNWNEERKRRVEERDLLLELRRELELNLKELNNFNNSADQTVKDLELYWSYFKKEKYALNKDLVVDFVFSITETKPFSSEFNTLNSVITTSRINLINNEELRFYLNRLISAKKQLQDLDDERISLRNTQVIPELRKYFDLKNLRSYFLDPQKYDSKIYAENVYTFFSNGNYSSLISEYQKLLSFESGTCSWVIGILKETKGIIDLELKKYDDIPNKAIYGEINIFYWDGKMNFVPLESQNKQHTLWKGKVKLKEGEVAFVNRNSFAIGWIGSTFPAGDLIEKEGDYGKNLPVKEGTYIVIFDLENNTYEFIKQDD